MLCLLFNNRSKQHSYQVIYYFYFSLIYLLNYYYFFFLQIEKDNYQWTAFPQLPALCKKLITSAGPITPKPVKVAIVDGGIEHNHSWIKGKVRQVNSMYMYFICFEILHPYFEIDMK